jgi:hypothetical protein
MKSAKKIRSKFRFFNQSALLRLSMHVFWVIAGGLMIAALIETIATKGFGAWCLREGMTICFLAGWWMWGFASGRQSR